jgi:hypothetical protein
MSCCKRGWLPLTITTQSRSRDCLGVKPIGDPDALIEELVAVRTFGEVGDAWTAPIRTSGSHEAWKDWQ